MKDLSILIISLSILGISVSLFITSKSYEKEVTYRTQKIIPPSPKSKGECIIQHINKAVTEKAVDLINNHCTNLFSNLPIPKKELEKLTTNAWLINPKQWSNDGKLAVQIANNTKWYISSIMLRVVDKKSPYHSRDYLINTFKGEDQTTNKDSKSRFEHLFTSIAQSSVPPFETSKFIQPIRGISKEFNWEILSAHGSK